MGGQELALPLSGIPAVIQRERAALSEIVDIKIAVEAERRAAAITDLTKRAGLTVPIQNEATLYRADALARLSELVEVAQASGEIAKPGQRRNARSAGVSELPVSSQRVAEGRLIARSGAVAKIEAELNGSDTAISMQDVLRVAKSGDISAIKSSESNEWYTPATYIEAARRTLGDIDLDPASSEQANGTVRAKLIHTLDDDGLAHEWRGRVFLNPPYGGKQGPFVAKLVEAYTTGEVSAAICLVSAYGTDTTWFQPLWDGLLCFLTGRIRWGNPSGRVSSATIGSVFCYFGTEPRLFQSEFSQFGPIVQRLA